MENLSILGGQSIPDWLAALIGAAAVYAFRYLTGYFRNEREANDIYKSLNEALEKKLTIIQKTHNETLEEVKKLKEEIQALSSQNKGYQGLIVLGLQAYFESHPKEARALGRAQLAPNITK